MTKFFEDFSIHKWRIERITEVQARKRSPRQILASVQEPVAKTVAVIIVSGLTLAFGHTAGDFRRLIQIVFGLLIAFAAPSFFLCFISFGGPGGNNQVAAPWRTL